MKENNPDRETAADSAGYKSPPESGRFKAGRSGNPHGRPKGARNFVSDLREELAEEVEVPEGTGVAVVSKQRAIIKRVVKAALGGDARAVVTLFTFCVRVLGEAGDESLADEIQDREIMTTFRSRRSRARKASTRALKSDSQEQKK